MFRVRLWIIIISLRKLTWRLCGILISRFVTDITHNTIVIMSGRISLRNRIRNLKLLLINLSRWSLRELEYLLPAIVHKHSTLMGISDHFLVLVLGHRSLILILQGLIKSILTLYFWNIWCSYDIMFISNNFRILRILLIAQLCHYLLLLKPTIILSLMNLVYLCHVRYSLFRLHFLLILNWETCLWINNKSDLILMLCIWIN
jgi:hypothetical protein